MENALFKKIFLMSVLGSILVACASPNPSRTQNVGNHEIFWKDFSKVSDLHKRHFNFSDGARLYMFGSISAVQFKMSNGDIASTHYEGCNVYRGTDLLLECYDKQNIAGQKTPEGLDLERLVELAERAVKAEGSCKWLGYDRELDLQARRLGSLASVNDQRLFFAKLRCS